MTTCPICQTDKLTNHGETSPENGGAIYVAEDTGCSTECYAIVDLYECASGHSFFLTKDV